MVGNVGAKLRVTDEYYSGEKELVSSIGDKTIISASFSINRYTGSSTGLYVTDKINRSG